MTYLLDPNACIALINGKPATVRTRFREAVAGGAQVNVSSVVAFELWYGVAKSEQKDSNTVRVETFFAGPISLMPFEGEDARTAGRIRAELEGAGRPIGAYDLLIAGQSVARKVTLVTANRKEFARVKNLVWEDWAAP